MFGVLYKEDRYEHDPYDKDGNGYSVKVDKFVDLPDEAAVLEWVRKNDESYKPIKGYRIFKLTEVKVKKTISFDLSSEG